MPGFPRPAIPVRPPANAPREEEQALVDRIRNGDPQAFETLYRKYYPELSRYATATTRSAATAEEVVQDVFLGVWRRHTEWRVEHGVAVYLYGAVRNRVLNAGRQAATATRFAERVHHDIASFSELQVTPAAPDDLAEANELHAAVRQAIAQLRERDRSALQLRWIDELTYAQLGALFGMTEEGARLMVQRAERAVRAAVRPLFDR